VSRGEPAAYAHLEVVDTGPLALVQDGGRAGLASMGVSPSGAADRGAFELGARLLGQGPRQAAVECLTGGLALRAHGSVTVALTGARVTLTVDAVPMGYAAPFLVRDGQLLRLARPAEGLRSYVSVRGGIDVEPVLGSRSHDTLSELGPAPLTAGQLLPVGRALGDPPLDAAPVRSPSGGLVELAVLPGPRWEWLDDPASLTTPVWLTAAASDRVGVRLEGPALARSPRHRAVEVPSEGVVRGAVQLPANGQPVVFLADHPVTGGYPVVAVLTRRAADQAAQLVPGQPVRLRFATSPR
jgi:biotin-dependent carboxylase-like uncharacterized protein